MKKHLYFLIAAVLACLFSFNACGGDDVSVTGLTLDKTVISVNAGSTERLTANVYPTNAKNKNVSWASSDASVASVSDGVVNGVAPGSVRITATTENGNFNADCTVTVTVPPATGVALNKTSASSMGGGDERLTATAAPAAADQTVTWTSSNHAVASVAGNGDGTVVSVSPGTANITATTANGRFATCAVTVTRNNIVVTGVTVAPSSLTIYKSMVVPLMANVYPPNAPPSNPPTPIIWSSSDESKATVSSTGIVTSLAAGSATITASYGLGENAPRGICSVTVLPPPPVNGVSLNRTSTQMELNSDLRFKATVTPALAENKAVTWSSSDPDTVSVNSAGLGTAKALGCAKITVRTVDGGFTASCDVEVLAEVTNFYIAGSYEELPFGGTVWQYMPFWAKNDETKWLDPNVVDLGRALSVFVDDEGTSYIAGWNDANETYYNQAVLWTDGSPNHQILANPEANPVSMARSVAVSGENVYVAGYCGNPARPYFWLNGVPTLLPYSGSYAEANHITVSGSTVYVAGFDFTGGVQRAVIWQNGARTDIHPDGAMSSNATSVYISGNSVYVTLNYSIAANRTVSGVWKDGVMQPLSEIDVGFPTESIAGTGSIVVVGDDVHVAGYAAWVGRFDTRYESRYWINGVRQELETHLEYAHTMAHSAHVYKGDVYVSGGIVYDTGAPYYERVWELTIWKNGKRFKVISGPPWGYNLQFVRARSIFVTNK
ncbi:MAG: Ig-like domain-containing protein [Holophagales bacterium]|jgi:uncharacterized protein YjdB|nr:Ig-like domain-containing protein [Holophagales bacterium]